jgi:hypothetical protein
VASSAHAACTIAADHDTLILETVWSAWRRAQVISKVHCEWIIRHTRTRRHARTQAQACRHAGTRRHADRQTDRQTDRHIRTEETAG